MVRNVSNQSMYRINFFVNYYNPLLLSIRQSLSEAWLAYKRHFSEVVCKRFVILIVKLATVFQLP